MDYSDVRGFNYQPSYGSTSFENWLYFNPDIVELELRRGKQHFPRFNAVRLWLSWAAWVRDRKSFGQSFETALTIADRLGVAVVPCLFNRWHNEFDDNDGIYIDHFMPGWSWLSRDQWKSFRDYLEMIVGAHTDDERVLCWDMCNEPFSYTKPVSEMKEIEQAEYSWLAEMIKSCRRLGARAPIGVSLHPGHRKEGLQRIEPISDILLIHPYFIAEQDDRQAKESYVQLLDDYADVRDKTGKPMLVTEAAWGSLDDNWRVENIRYSLAELKKRNIGWILHALHYSKVADLHGPEDGPVGGPGNLAFIQKDGTLRPGHEVFNQF